MKSKRQLQMGENIKRIMSNIFMNNDLLVIDGNLVTILRADISPDATSVKIFIDIVSSKSVENNSEQSSLEKKSATEEKILRKVQKLTPALRHKLAIEADFRSVPQIKFLLDKSNEEVIRISNLLESQE
jgi:ribosome-binding factor A